MKYVVYILQSHINGRYYIGHTHDIDKRIHEHNEGKVRLTKAYRPWNIVYIESYDSKQDAYRREMKIKSYKHGEAFLKLLENTERC